MQSSKPTGSTAMFNDKYLLSATALALGAGLGSWGEAQASAVIPSVIIINDFSPDIVINNATTAIDVDGNGVNDFSINSFSSSDINSLSDNNKMNGNGGQAYKLLAGDIVDSNDTFFGGKLHIFNSNSPGGPWNFGDTGYLGLEFDINGQRHYGALEITIGSVTVLRGLYQSAPNTPLQIPAPEPGSLLLLAIGAAGLLGWRRGQRRQALAA